MLHKLALLLLLALAISTSAQTLPFAPATAPGTSFDLQAFLDQQLLSGQRRITIPPGRYRLTPTHRQHLLLANLQNVEILADNVEILCTETTRALTITDCTNLTLRGLTIDYDPLPFTQGRITELSPDKTLHTIELFPGYPAAAAVQNAKYQIYRPDTRDLRARDHFPSKLEVLGTRTIRLTIPACKPADPEQVGDLIVINASHAPHGSIPHAIYTDRGTRVRLENITLYSSNNFGFYETNCTATTYDRCRIDRRPPSEDLIPRADPRLRSLDADAFHSKHALQGPALLNCLARFMGDDGINICGDYHMVMSASGKDLRILAKRSLTIQPGDPLELQTYDGRLLPSATAVAVAPAGRITDDERDFLLKQHLYDPLRKAQDGHLTNAFAITLDRAVDLPRGSVIAASNRLGRGFIIKDCTFGPNRSRGILIKASDGEISNNTLVGNWMPAIAIAPEYWWLEAGSSSNLKITGNTIRDCRQTSIAIVAPVGHGPAPAGLHRNLTLTGNTITRGPLPNIHADATDTLLIENNTFLSPLPPAKPNAPPLLTDPIQTSNCTHVTIQNNTTQPATPHPVRSEGPPTER